MTVVAAAPVLPKLETDYKLTPSDAMTRCAGYRQEAGKWIVYLVLQW